MGPVASPTLDSVLLCRPCDTGLKASLKSRNLRNEARGYYVISEGGRRVREGAKTSEEEERGDAGLQRRESS